MLHDARAVVFDLDDTLYPLRRFVISGFAAVARDMERRWSIDARQALAVLTGASSRKPGRELQICCDRFGLPATAVGDFIHLIRAHSPAIALPRASRAVLQKLRAGWRLGVLTNGLPDLQARKIDALGLRFLVDAVVFANEVGDGAGKPSSEAFVEVARRLQVPADRTVFVGDDERCDMFGAARAGMRTIHFTGLLRQPPGRPALDADATVESLAAVPELAARLVAHRWRSDVA
jgi:FMN phosphatase YigB (HAD superfamily)